MPSSRPARKQAPGDLEVLRAGLGIAAGVVVGADHGGRRLAHRRPKDLARVDQRGGEGALAHALGAAQAVLAVEQEHVERLPLEAAHALGEQVVDALRRAQRVALGTARARHPAPQGEGGHDARGGGGPQAVLAHELPRALRESPARSARPSSPGPGRPRRSRGPSRSPSSSPASRSSAPCRASRSRSSRNPPSRAHPSPLGRLSLAENRPRQRREPRKSGRRATIAGGHATRTRAPPPGCDGAGSRFRDTSRNGLRQATEPAEGTSGEAAAISRMSRA